VVISNGIFFAVGAFNAEYQLVGHSLPFASFASFESKKAAMTELI
jgi:hypothetical protein